MSAEPTYICSKCGFIKVVKINPESTARWFKKYHKCKAPIVYRAGFDLSDYHARKNNEPIND